MKTEETKARNSIDLKPYSTIDLCRIYGVSPKTINKWLAPFRDELGPRIGRYYTITQVKVIFQKLSLPSKIEID